MVELNEIDFQWSGFHQRTHFLTSKVFAYWFYCYMVHSLTSRNDGSTEGSTKGYTGSTDGRLFLFVAPDLSNFGSFCCKTSVFLPTWRNKYCFTWRRCLMHREFYMFIVVCNKSSWEICLPEEKECFVFIVAYVWRCREMSRAHRIKQTRFVQPKGIKGFSSEYTKSFS